MQLFHTVRRSLPLAVAFRDRVQNKMRTPYSFKNDTPHSSWVIALTLRVDTPWITISIILGSKACSLCSYEHDDDLAFCLLVQYRVKIPVRVVGEVHRYTLSTGRG